MRIFLVGGGTGGPTAPVFAVAGALRELQPQTEFFFISTGTVIDKRFQGSLKIKADWLTIPAGKWRRYFSPLNLVDIFKTLYGFLRFLYLLKKNHPDIIFGAGSFVQVPVAWAARISGIPVVIHQQDLTVLLSTRLALPATRLITTTFDLTAKDLPDSSGLFAKTPRGKVVVTGNPLRRELLRGSVAQARQVFGLNDKFPTLLVIGGGGGARRLNEAIISSLPELTKYVQVIHITGGRSKKIVHSRYHQFEFLEDDLAHAYAVADLVISRAGMSTIAELSALGKAAIIVPLPNSAQMENVRYLASCKAAVGVLEDYLEPRFIVSLVRKILWNREIQNTLKTNIKKIMPHDADQKIAKLLIKVYEESRAKK